MKQTRKMVLVDYDKYNQNYNRSREINVNPKPLFNLDKSMYEILQRNDLSDYEKHKLYAGKLSKYLFFINQQAKRRDVRKNETITPKPEPKLVSKPEPKSESERNDSNNEFFDDGKTSNEEFYDFSQSEEDNPFITMKPRPYHRNETISNFSSEFSSPSNTKQNKMSTPKQNRKNKKKKSFAREGSPMNLRSSHPKNQLGGWFTFNDMIRNKFN
jgi:hypothetical protein